jgi:glycosyltransferase involved in cell wall biosynthesis
LQVTERPLYVLICPPWPRSGSSSVFAAQAKTYLSQGHELAVVVSPHSAAHREKYSLLWKTVREDFSFATKGGLYLNRSNGRIRRLFSMAYWDWLIAGRDSVLAIEERYAARAQIDPALLKRIRAQGVALIHVNHAFNMGVARRIAAVAQCRGFARPKIILETHDVQAQRIGRGQLRNYLSGRVDSSESVMRDETRILGRADALIHISEADIAHFRQTLPGHPHFLLRPTTRNQPLSSERKATPTIDFLFVGNAHAANIASIQWLLDSVMPRLAGLDLRIRIVGAISGWFRQKAPEVYAKYPDIWMDEQPQIADLYNDSRFVIVPTTLATGASIKLIEALAMGKHVVATPMAMAAFATTPGIDAAVRVAGDAAGFAAAMQDLAGRPDEPNLVGLDIYSAHFSNACYQRSLLKILREELGGLA